MSLIDNMMESFIFMEKSRNPDGEGGTYTTWEEGAEFMAALVLNSTMEAMIAEAQGVHSVYELYVDGNVDIEYRDVIKRTSDGKYFRVTSDPKDQRSPKSASFDIMKMTAERWELE